MLLLTGAEGLQNFQRQAVVIMRKNWLPLFLFPTIGRQPKVPNPAPPPFWLPQLIRLWSRATGSAVKHSHHLCRWEETRPFWSIVLASPVWFLIHPFDRKRKKNLLLLCSRFPLCSTNLSLYPKVIVILKHAALVEIYKKIIFAYTPTMGLKKLQPPWSFPSITSRQGMTMSIGRAEKGDDGAECSPFWEGTIAFCIVLLCFMKVEELGHKLPNFQIPKNSGLV